MEDDPSKPVAWCFRKPGIFLFIYGLIGLNIVTVEPLDTLGTQPFVLCREAVLFRRLFRILYVYIGTLVGPLFECKISL